MELLQILVLAIVQGITEFLPISSSGHLVIVEELFQNAGPTDERTQLAVNIFLHLGTLFAVLAFYWRPLLRLLTTDRRVLGLLIVGTLPAAVVGLTIKELVPALATNALLSGLMLPVTGCFLLLSVRIPAGDLDYRQLTWTKALAIGTAQAVAILPGISRSGSTIVAGLCVGLRREDAATFSFLLAVPVIAGATLLETLSLLKDGMPAVSPGNLGLGVIVAFAVGLAALGWLLRWLRQGRLYLFAWWCFAVGAGVIAWQIWAGQHVSS